MVRVAVLGSTGSVGTQTLEVIEHLNALAAKDNSLPTYQVTGLATGRNQDAMRQQAQRLNVTSLALAAQSASSEPDMFVGPDAAERLVRSLHERGTIDIVVGAIVGNAGLSSTIAAAELGIDIVLANKEPLVAAGALVTRAAHASGARLLPVDSEHAALWQCLRALDGANTPPFRAPHPEVRRLILTASGGSLRDMPLDEMRRATPKQALKHPVWDMGPKVTIDSASLTNKAFELIEAHWLFAMPEDTLDVLVHPTSIVHSLVEFRDATLLAQLGVPDMKSPIQHALAYPRRLEPASDRLDLSKISTMHFAEPDEDRYPSLRIARRVMREGGTSGAVFNGANEAAVEAFLSADGAMPFGRIAELVEHACDTIAVRPIESIADVFEADCEAREHVQGLLHASAGN